MILKVCSKGFKTVDGSLATTDLCPLSSLACASIARPSTAYPSLHTAKLFKNIELLF